MKTVVKKSTKSGEKFENYVLDLILDRGFVCWSYKKFVKTPYNQCPDLLVVKNYPYESASKVLARKFGIVQNKSRSSRTEFVICAKNAKSVPEFSWKNDGKWFTARIECKWQEKSGSTKEKLPGTVLNFCTIPEKNAILVMSGDNFNAADHFLVKTLCENRKHLFRSIGFKDSKDNIVKMTVKEFAAWLKKAFC